MSRISPAQESALERKLLPDSRHEFRPRFCVTCRGSGAFLQNRSSHRRHARPSRRYSACRRSLFASAAASGSAQTRRGTCAGVFVAAAHWSAKRSRNSIGERSTTPLAPGRVDVLRVSGRPSCRPKCRGSSWRTLTMRPSAPRFTESRSNANGGLAQCRNRCSKLTIDTQLGNHERDTHARVNGKTTILPGEHVCGVEQASKPGPPHDAARSAAVIDRAGRNTGGASASLPKHPIGDARV